jgi:hypothetical protein
MSECEMPFDEDKVTNYNPLHKEVGLVPQKRVSKYIERVTHNKYIFEDPKQSINGFSISKKSNLNGLYISLNLISF